MTDTAVLGLQVDSGPVKAATEDLRNFEAVARRTGETVEQVRDRFAKLAANSNQLAASLSAAPVQAIQRNVIASGQTAVQSFNASALAARAFIASFNPMGGLPAILQR